MKHLKLSGVLPFRKIGVRYVGLRGQDRLSCVDVKRLTLSQFQTVLNEAQDSILHGKKEEEGEKGRKQGKEKEKEEKQKFGNQKAGVVEGFPGGSDGKESACSVEDLGSIPGLGRSPGGGHGNPLQYSCLKNPHEQRAWRTTVHGISESDTIE